MKLSPRKRVLILAGFLAVPLFGFIHVINKPRVLAVDEVPIAYWAWRTNAPGPVDVEKAFAVTHAKTLFIRAGQIDLGKKKFKRIRPLEGRMPSWVELHLVYNATPDLLHNLESVDLDAFATTISETYKADLVRSRNESAQVFGLQLDLDFPNRLLPKYATLLNKLHPLLPRDTKLSITGLPAWMASSDLATVLDSVDFWIPQCYGSEIPTHISKRIPISSASDVAQTVDQAGRLGKPFYAGLAAYSYVILYGTDGNLVELRGNIDPAAVEKHPELEQTERRSFTAGEPGAVRYEYRAKGDLVLEGLIVRAGQTVVLDVPSSASLRASARAVRENGGGSLLGICLFRLPISTDEAVLTIDQIKPALADTETKVQTKVTLEHRGDELFTLRVTNNGTACTILGEDAFTIDIDLPAGSAVRAVDHKGFSNYETLCRTVGDALQPCSGARANVLRLRSDAWKPGARATADLEIGANLSQRLHAVVTTRVDDGRTLTETFKLSASDNE